MKRLITAILLVATAGALPAQQVGYAPGKSPYRDLDQTMELSFLAGHYTAPADPAGVSPQGGGIWSLLYGWHAAGPLFIDGMFSRVASQRHVIDPLAANKDRGIENWPLYAVDGLMSLSLTGDRTFHGFMPLLNVGTGFITDRHLNSDVGDYQFGTRWEALWGASLRYVVSNRWAVRADLTNHFYSGGYPATYYVVGKDGNAILGAQQSKSFWRNNPAFTLGVSYLFSR